MAIRAADQSSAAASGCSTGQEWLGGRGLGVPHRVRTAEVTELTGFQSAISRSQLGMWRVGTKALEMNASGKMMRKPTDIADSGDFAMMPAHAVGQVRA